MATMSTMSVLFADVVASTETRSRVGDDAADELNRELIDALGAAVVESGGTVVKTLGDGLMAVFSSTASALSAAIASQQAAWWLMQRHPEIELPLRVGVSVGEVAGDDGDWMGTPVVEAARLCDAAEPSQILVADVVRLLAGSRGGFRYTAVGALELKGLPEPLQAVAVAWTPPAEAAAASPSSGFPAALASARTSLFVGRDDDVTALLDGWKAGRWRGLFVAGEPGAGKTRLVAEIAHWMAESGAVVLLGRCDEDLAVSYRPWTEALDPFVMSVPLDVLRQLVDATGGDLVRVTATLRRRLPDVPAPTAGEPTMEQAATADSVVHLFSALTSTAPIVVVIDDMQWSDRASLTLLRQVLTADIPGLAIIGNYQDTQLDRAHPLSHLLADLRPLDRIERIALAGLSVTQVEQLFETAVGDELDPHTAAVAAMVHAETSGNPLFVGQLLRHLIESGDVGETGRRWLASGSDGIDLPDGLREVVERRLSRLSDETNHTLRVAAVVGREFHIDVVEQVLGRDVLDDLDAASDAGLVTGVDGLGRYEFRHAVLRETLLKELSPPRRSRVHRDVAEVLEARWTGSNGAELDALAFHHACAGTPEAPRWCLRASRAAEASFRYDEALTVARRGLDVLEQMRSPDLALRCDLRIEAAAGTYSTLTAAETLEFVHLALADARELHDAARMTAALMRLGTGSTWVADPERMAIVREAMAMLDRDDQISWLQLERLSIGLENVGPLLDPAQTWARLDHLVDTALPLIADPLVPPVVHFAALTYAWTGKPDTAVAVLDRLPPESLQTMRVPTERVAAHARLSLGDRDGFEEMSEAFATANRRCRFWLAFGQAAQFEAMARLLDGDFAQAPAAIDAVLDVSSHEANFEFGWFIQRSWLQCERGDFDGWAATLEQLRAADPDFLGFEAMRAQHLSETGRRSEADALLDSLAADDFAAVGRGWLTMYVLGSLAWAAVTTGATRHAAALQRLLGQYSGLALVVGSGTHVVAGVDRLLAGLAALAGDGQEADRLFAAALDMEERGLRSPPLAARTRHWWARALIRRGDADLARPLIEESRAAAARLGMSALLDQLDHIDARSV